METKRIITKTLYIFIVGLGLYCGLNTTLLLFLSLNGVQYNLYHPLYTEITGSITPLYLATQTIFITAASAIITYYGYKQIQK